MIEKNEKRIGKNWMDGKILHLIALGIKIKFEFVINEKKQDKFQFI
jgi:hypothetical protein